jgi:hypothetical protein
LTCRAEGRGLWEAAMGKLAVQRMGKLAVQRMGKLAL